MAQVLYMAESHSLPIKKKINTCVITVLAKTGRLNHYGGLSRYGLKKVWSPEAYLSK